MQYCDMLTGAITGCSGLGNLSILQTPRTELTRQGCSTRLCNGRSFEVFDSGRIEVLASLKGDDTIGRGNVIEVDDSSLCAPCRIVRGGQVEGGDRTIAQNGNTLAASTDVHLIINELLRIRSVDTPYKESILRNRLVPVFLLAVLDIKHLTVLGTLHDVCLVAGIKGLQGIFSGDIESLDIIVGKAEDVTFEGTVTHRRQTLVEVGTVVHQVVVTGGLHQSALGIVGVIVVSQS